MRCGEPLGAGHTLPLDWVVVMVVTFYICENLLIYALKIGLLSCMLIIPQQQQQNRPIWINKINIGLEVAKEEMNSLNSYGRKMHIPSQ